REVLRELRRHAMPHGVRLRIAVQQQERRARAAAAQADRPVTDRDVIEREARKEHGGYSSRWPPSYMQAMRPRAARSSSLASKAGRSGAADGARGSSAVPRSICAAVGEKAPVLPASSPRSTMAASRAGSNVGSSAKKPCFSTSASL